MISLLAIIRILPWLSLFFESLVPREPMSNYHSGDAVARHPLTHRATHTCLLSLMHICIYKRSLIQIRMTLQLDYLPRFPLSHKFLRILIMNSTVFGTFSIAIPPPPPPPPPFRFFPGWLISFSSYLSQ